MLHLIKDDRLITTENLHAIEVDDYEYFGQLIDDLTANPDKKIFIVCSNDQAMQLIFVILDQINQNIDSKDPWSNTIDPFGYSLGSAFSTEDEDDLRSHADKEMARQKEKSTSNSIGYFHQGLLRFAFNDPRPISELFKNDKEQPFDVISDCHNIGLEVKSKWNTTKGNSRDDLYKKLGNAKGLSETGKRYFVEVLDRPGANNERCTEENYSIQRCNGSYIYKVAAEKLNAEKPGETFKTITENFPAMVWLFSKLYTQTFSQSISNKIKRQLTDLKNDLSIEPDKETKAAKEVRMLIIDYINEFFQPTPDTEKLDGFASDLSNKRPKPENLKRIKNEVMEYIAFHERNTNLNRFCKSLYEGLEKSFKGEDNLNFFNDNLVGHLF